MQASIRRIDLDAAGYRCIELDAPGFRFRSGQYLTIDCDGTEVPLSIASAAERLPRIHLIYRSDATSIEAIALDKLLANTTQVTLGCAAGSIRVPSADAFHNLHLIAGGTGLAGALGLADAVLTNGSNRSVRLTWTSSQTPSWLHQLATEHRFKNLHIERTTNAELSTREWQARNNGWFLLCGAPEFVYPLFDRMCLAGIEANQIASDVFDYAPR